MHAWEAIQKTLDYIEEHIVEEIKIEDLADIASLSLFYYQRLFSRLVKRPVRDYLDIALAYGFGSHETFTRAFKEVYGMTPEQYRRKTISLNQFDKPDLLLGYTLIDEGVPLISEGLVLEINRKIIEEPTSFIGVSGYVPIAEQLPVGETTGIDVPGEIWRQFHQEKNRINRISNGCEVGVAYLGDAPEGCFTYKIQRFMA
ncbi:MAG: AraC family transcriptional regulator [Herbinix sp.]|nr:AraC family transcriptional regulator [Herbinix sp.]